MERCNRCEWNGFEWSVDKCVKMGHKGLDVHYLTVKRTSWIAKHIVHWFARLNQIDGKQRDKQILMERIVTQWSIGQRQPEIWNSIHLSMAYMLQIPRAGDCVFEWFTSRLLDRGFSGFSMHKSTSVLINSNNCRCRTSKTRNHNNNNGPRPWSRSAQLSCFPSGKLLAIMISRTFYYNHLSMRDREEEEEAEELSFFFSNTESMRCSARNNGHCDSFFHLSYHVLAHLYCQIRCLYRLCAFEDSGCLKSEHFIHKHK